MPPAPTNPFNQIGNMFKKNNEGGIQKVANRTKSNIIVNLNMVN